MRNIKNIVLEILNTEPETRNSDNKLISRVIAEILPESKNKTFSEVMRMVIENEISFESITRCRRDLQEKNEDLRADKKVEEFRDLKEIEYREEYGLSKHIPRLD